MPDLHQLFTAASYRPNALSLATLVAALAVLSLGVGVLVEGRRVASSSRFFLVTAAASAWLASFAAMYAANGREIALDWARAGYVAAAIVPPAVFHLSVSLVGVRRRDQPRLWLAWSGAAVVAVLAAFTDLLIPAVRRYPWGWYPAGRPWGGVIVLFFTGVFAASLHRLWLSFRRSEGKARERSGALLLAFVLGSLSMFDYLPAIGIELPPIGHLAAMAFVLVATAAIWRFDLAEITPEYAANQILETMKGSVVVADLQGTIRVVNRSAAAMLGQDPAGLRGKHIRSILHGDSNLSTGKLLSSLGVLEQSMVWRAADGTTVDVLVSSSFLRAPGGEPVGVVYVASDFTERKRAEEELRRSEERYRELFENANDIVYTHDLEGTITSMNLAGERASGYSRQELVGTQIRELLVPEHVERAREAMERKLRGEATSTFYEVDMVARDGRRLSLELSTRLIYRGGKPVGVQGIARDVSERKASEARYRLLFERNLAGVYRTDIDGRILECNEACARLFGYASVDEFRQADARAFYFDESERERIVQILREQRQISNMELRLRRRDGSPVWVLENVTMLEGGVLEGTLIDINDRKIAQEQIEYQAYHDVLTGLPNRALFRDRVAVALAHAARGGRTAAVMFLDLDQFKLVNDTLGHTVGDRLLQAVGLRLVACVRAEDTVGRMGGDEFTILLADLADRSGAAAVASKVLEAVRQPVLIDEHELFMTTSVGIAVFPEDGEDAEALLKNADRAMYHAKELGRDNFQYAAQARLEMAGARRSLERGLRHAAERGELVVHYQPMVEIATGRVAGAEALLRWNHPELGMLQPEEFVAIAEESRLIVPLGEWVLRTACGQMKAWHDGGHDWLRLAVNLSPRQFQDRLLIETIDRALADTAFPPNLLDLEITESTAMQDAELTLSILHQIKEKGIRISIDDFGTGYSSLSYLRRFPIDTVKIDQDFVRELTPDDAAIISAVISMARALDLRVVAEGVETEEQLDFLRRERCGEMQGFLYSQPLAADEFERALRGTRPVPQAERWAARLRLTSE